MSDMELCQRLVDRVGGRAEAAATVLRGPSALTRFANSFIHQNVAEDRVAVSLTVARESKSATVSSTRTDESSLEDLVEQALAITEFRPADPDWPGMAPRADIASVDHFDEATARADPAERAEIVRAFVAAGEGLLGAGFCATEGDRVSFANSAGQRCQGAATRAVLDGIHQTQQSAGKAHQTASAISDLDAVAAGTGAARRARDGVDAIDLEPGRYEVVLEPNAVATIAVFLSIYGFNARAAIEQRTFVDLGTQQLDRSITLIDDATRADALGLTFDAEGTPKRPLALIEAGVPRSLAHDRRTARRMDTESTGHALSGAMSFGPVASNLFVEPGTETVESMTASVDRGLLVTEFNYCRVLDPRTLGVTGLTRNGTFLIENGEIVGPVTNLRFTQSFVEALGPGAVLGVESEARFADSEFGPGFAHVPGLRLAEWNFTGGAGG